MKIIIIMKQPAVPQDKPKVSDVPAPDQPEEIVVSTPPPVSIPMVPIVEILDKNYKR